MNVEKFPGRVSHSETIFFEALRDLRLAKGIGAIVALLKGRHKKLIMYNEAFLI